MSASLHDSDTTASRNRGSIQARLHRIDGSALEPPSGSREWYVRGERHRRDAPAVVDAEKGREWWIFGQPTVRADPPSSAWTGLERGG